MAEEMTMYPEDFDTSFYPDDQENPDALILEKPVSILKQYQEFVAQNKTEDDTVSSDDEDDELFLSLKSRIRSQRREYSRRSIVEHTRANLNKSLALIAENYNHDVSYENSLDKSEISADDAAIDDEVEPQEQVSTELDSSLDFTMAVITKKQFCFRSMSKKKILKLFEKLSSQLETRSETYPELIAENIGKSLDNCINTLRMQFEKAKERANGPSTVELCPNESTQQFIDCIDKLVTRIARINDLKKELAVCAESRIMCLNKNF